MKKLLLTLAAIVGLGFAANAEQVTLKCSALGTTTNSSLTEWKANDTFTFTMAKNGGMTAPAYNKAGDIRLYADNTLELKGANVNIQKVVFTISTAGKKRLTEVKASVGEIAAQASGDATVTWSGEASAITFTVGKKARYGTDGADKAGQFDFDEVTITYTSALSGDQKPAGLSFDETAVTVIEGQSFTAPTLNNPNNLPVVWGSSDETVATVNNGAVTIVGVGETTISAKSEATTEFGAGNASYTLTVVKAYKSVAEFYTLGDGEKGLIGFDLVVTYVSGNNCYAQTKDGKEATLIFGKNTYEVGDVIPAGWEGTYSPFNGLPEIKPVGTMPAATGKETVTYPEVTSVSADDVNKIVVLKEVKFENDPLGPVENSKDRVNFEGKVGDTTYSFRNNFLVEATAKGTYNVKCAVATFNGSLQLYPISYTKPTTAITEIEAAENAPVEYFNLQGVRVANPENGLYIRRQGNKVTKVIVK